MTPLAQDVYSLFSLFPTPNPKFWIIFRYPTPLLKIEGTYHNHVYRRGNIYHICHLHVRMEATRYEHRRIDNGSSTSL